MDMKIEGNGTGKRLYFLEQHGDIEIRTSIPLTDEFIYELEALIMSGTFSTIKNTN